VSSVKDKGDKYEVIVVDDGSDLPIENSRLEHNSIVRLIRYDVNQGKGHALAYGAAHANGDNVIFLDSDGDIDVAILSKYVAALKDADMVIGSKRHPLSNVKCSTGRKFLSCGFFVIVKILTGTRVTDTQSGLKAFRSEALRRILPLVSVKKYAFDVELLTIAQLLGMKVAEMPITMRIETGFSKRATMRMLIDLLGIAYRLRVLRWYQSNAKKGRPAYSPIIKW